MAGILTFHPFKAIYTLLAVLYELAKFPLWLVLYVFRIGRPHGAWSLNQTIRMHIVRAFLKHVSVIRAAPKLSLKPGSEKERFSIIQPQEDWAYTGPAEDRTIKPEKIGGTWHPSPLQRSQADGADVVIHFHGGGYVIGDGRDADAGFAAQTILKHSKVTHVLCPQYRLASRPGGRFPAALQDAITSYMYVTDKLRVPPSQITISGDSAGGNLALGLLRYIHEHGENLGLGWPGAVFLWSPWVDVSAGINAHNIIQSPQYHTDYLSAAFGYWGSTEFSKDNNPRHPYISPLGHAFKSKSPIWIQTGRAEVLYDADIDIARQFKEAGTTVELVVNKNAPHDIILIGPIIGFVEEAQNAAKAAGEFLRANRYE